MFWGGLHFIWYHLHQTPSLSLSLSLSLHLSLSLSPCSTHVWRAARNRPVSVHAEELVPKQPRLKKLLIAGWVRQSSAAVVVFGLQQCVDRRCLVDRLADSTSVCGAVCHAWLVISQQSENECESYVLNTNMQEDQDSVHYVGGIEHTCDVTVFCRFRFNYCVRCVYIS
jgi:hypothetical protein